MMSDDFPFLIQALHLASFLLIRGFEIANSNKPILFPVPYINSSDSGNGRIRANDSLLAEREIDVQDAMDSLHTFRDKENARERKSEKTFRALSMRREKGGNAQDEYSILFRRFQVLFL